MAASKLSALKRTTLSSTKVEALSKYWSSFFGFPLATARSNVLTPYQLIFSRATDLGSAHCDVEVG
jgi:hypothetical protein